MFEFEAGYRQNASNRKTGQLPQTTIHYVDTIEAASFALPDNGMGARAGEL